MDMLNADDRAVAAMSGMADALVGYVVTGWAIDETSPLDAASVDIFVDGEKVGATSCDQVRQDLATLGYPRHGGGFSFPIPGRFMDGDGHVLRIAFHDGTPMMFHSRSGEQLPEVRFRSERAVEIDGFVDGIVGSGICGWVVRRNNETGHSTGGVQIQVRCNGAAIGQFIADHVRQDVGQAKKCSPRVGFDFQIPAEFRTGRTFSFSLWALPEDVELRQSPIRINYPSTDATSKLYALKDVVDELCSRAWSVQREIMRMLPTGGTVTGGYDAWARRYYADLTRRTATLPPAHGTPLVSIVMPTYKPDLRDFIAAIASVSKQTYANWELLIVDDASRSRTLTSCIQDHARQDRRIRLIRQTRNSGISTATNAALQAAQGEFVAFFDHDDLLVDVAIETMVRAALSTGARILYSDEDKIDETGVYSEPNLKPDWNYRFLLCQNYICHLLMVERALLQQVGPLRTAHDGAQDHDLLLRLSETCPADRILHVSELLYHWRKSATSTASSGDAKPYAIKAGLTAVTDHLRRRGFETAEVTSIGARTMYSVEWNGRQTPSVCIIIPFKDQAGITRRCLEEVLAHTDYPNWRIVLVDNGSESVEAKRLCRDYHAHPLVTIRHVHEKFNYSRLNNIAAKENPADFFVFLNNDVFLRQGNWLRILLDEALADPRVAIVGAKLLYPDRMVQHAGIVLGVGGIADHAFRGIPDGDPGYVARAWCAQQYSAVTAACMLCRAQAFREVGGFDEVELAVAFNDVDLCLRVGASGWRVIWTPDLVAEHHESLSRGTDMAPEKAGRFFHENQLMQQRHGEVLRRDPFYNPIFSRLDGIFRDLGEIGSGS